MVKFIFKLPDIGEGITEAEIAEWKVKLGDQVEEDQPLVDMLTEKAAVELTSPVTGKVVALHGEAGEMVAIGFGFVELETDAAAAAEAAEAQEAGELSVEPEAAAEPPPAPKQAPPEQASSKPKAEAAKPAKPAAAASQRAAARPAVPRAAGEKPLASPAVRRRARELGVDLRYVHGSGGAGNISHEDLEQFVSAGGTVSGSAAPSNARAPRLETEQVKVIGLRRKIAEAMQRSKQRIPHFAYVEEVDVTELEALRQHMNATRKDGQPKLTLLPFLMRALVKLAPDYPQINATYDDEAGVVTRYAASHIGIATQTPNGLVVPVARHAETLDIWQSATEVVRLANAARDGKAKREELSGSSITITSLGPMGGIVSTPVINAPEVAIVGVNKMVERPMVLGGKIEIRKMMNLSSSFDHRIVDGWDAAEFIQKIKGLLEHPAALFVD